MRKNVTENDAKKVRDSVLAQCLRDSSPPIIRLDDGRWSIVWEEGPYEWPYIFPFGGIGQEFGFTYKDVSADIPEHLYIEPLTHYSIGLYLA